MKPTVRPRSLAALMLVLALLAALAVACGQKKTDHNEDKKANLGAWGRALSAIAVADEGGDPSWFGGQRKADAEAVLAQLSADWAVTDRASLIRSMNFYLRSGDREEYLYDSDVLARLRQLPEEEREQQLAGLSEEGALHYELVAYCAERWNGRGLLAWDMAQYARLAQLGYLARLLSHEEAQAAIEPAAAIIRQYFTGWEEVCQNILDGYALHSLSSPEAPEGAYRRWAAAYSALLEAEDPKAPLFDDGLFEADLLPLEELSSGDFMK